MFSFFIIINNLPGHGGAANIAKRLSSSFYNRFVRPKVEKAVPTETIEPPKKKAKKNYKIITDRYNAGAKDKADYEAGETLYLQMQDLTSDEKCQLLERMRSYIQLQFREKQPRQIIADLELFWTGGPKVLSSWFLWITDSDVNLEDTAQENLNKVMSLVAEFLLNKKGDQFEQEMITAKATSVENSGNLIQFHVFLMRQLAKMWKNKPEQVLFLSGEDQLQIMTELPVIHISKRNMMGIGDYDVEVVVSVRIGDATVYSDVTFTEAISALVQLYFTMHLHYPPECDDVYQVLQRMLLNFGSHDGARNKRNSTKKNYKEFESFVAQTYFDSKQGGVVKISS